METQTVLFGLPNLAGMFLSTLVGLGLLILRTPTSNQACAEQFQPIKEAELPRGFPTYTPVGEIEIKQYPAYRKASASGQGQFWTLFRHIKRNNVAMTAPVEMDYGNPGANEERELSMSFLYERPDQGSPGKQGSVEVIDVPATTVVSIGCRGERTASAIAEAREKLGAWLDRNQATYLPAGPLRIMGYNSPFVPRDKSFFEVQIPVKAANGLPEVADGDQHK
jgi:hypothetical protein